MKITIVGAGHVGTTTCQNMAIQDIADEIVLVDISKEVEGKVMDLMQSKYLYNFNTNIDYLYDDNTPDSYLLTSGSNIGIITCGIPRKPGMSREQLIDINYNIAYNVGKKLLQYSPNIILIVVTNPVDIISYMLYKNLDISKERIIGIGGILDTARFQYYIEKYTQQKKITNLYIIGSHSDTDMIPLTNYSLVNNKRLSDIVDSHTLNKIITETKSGGRIITEKQGYSAGYAPAASILKLVKAITTDNHEQLCCSVVVNGEYSLNNICIGVPVIIGKNGVIKIIQLDLNEEENKLMNNSAATLQLQINNMIKLM